MKRMAMSILLILLCLADITFAQKAPTDANIVGHVLADGMHIPFATISIKGTTLGVSTDETGHYRFINLPTGKHTLVARSVGYQQCETEVEIYTGQTKEINFQLKKSVQDIDEVEVTGHKNIVNRQAEPTIINTISPQLFANTQAVVLSQGLNYVPGLRMETKCVNSGFPQLRINGLDGIYSQVLINGRRMFRGMASVFGLEQVPSGIIDQVKVVRGGGSVLYGNNGIAGTIDLVLKEPINNSYEVGTHTSIIGVGLNKAGPTATDYTINMNTSIVSEDRNSGMTLYGFYRNTEPFDANNDSFSEMPETENITLGARLFHRMRNRNKLTLDFINISEKRRGGNQFELPMPLAEMAAAPEHGIKNVALNYGQFFRDIDKLSIYAAGQNVNVDAYRGAKGSKPVYDSTNETSFSVGTQYKFNMKHSNLVFGIEDDGARLTNNKFASIHLEENEESKKLLIADQFSNTLSVFSQYELEYRHLLISAGLRHDHFQVIDKGQSTFSNSGKILSPRFSLKYDLLKSLQARISYAEGYRAPEIRDEDLMVDITGSTKVINKVSPDLKAETSQTYVASFDFNEHVNGAHWGLLVEGFYTVLKDPFLTTVEGPDADGVVVYTRSNADKQAKVRGVNMELSYASKRNFSANAGFTIQRSEYTSTQDFNEKSFFRTPNQHGYLTADWQALKKLLLSVNANYTGDMLVPLYGPNAELRQSNPFFDIATKVTYNLKVRNATMQVFAGVKNIFNSYQDDFESGINRYPRYIYGPRLPRTIYLGLKLSSPGK